MKKLFLMLTVAMLALGVQSGWAEKKQEVPEYTIQSAGQGKDGRYLVKVNVYVKKKQLSEDALRECAMRGVLFRGFTDLDGASSQKPIVDDPNTEVTKKEWFEAFFREKAYERYVSLVDGSLNICKVPKKHYEATGLLSVDKESLYKYLEDNNIIKGFSNLW